MYVYMFSFPLILSEWSRDRSFCIAYKTVNKTDVIVIFETACDHVNSLLKLRSY